MSGRSEFDAIAAWTSGLHRAEGDPVGLGDDCAVLQLGDQTLLITTDASVEGVHFNLDWYDAEDAGYRAMAGAISDIAAMGGLPRVATVSLAVPTRHMKSADRFYAGLRAAADHCGVHIIGGDTTRSPQGLFCDITVIGQAVNGKYLLRSGAKPGDLLAITGHPGRAAAALGAFVLHGRSVSLPDAVRAAHLRPEPRIAVGRALCACDGVHAMLDVSDGLLQDARHLAERSGLGLRLNTGHAIEDQLLLEACRQHSLDARACYWGGGEDYELLFAATPDAIAQLTATLPLPLTFVGQFTMADGVIEIIGPPIAHEGYDHFLQ